MPKNNSKPSLDAEKKNGVYLLGIDSQRIGYVVESGIDRVHVKKITAHGNHVGTSDYFETECTDFKITDALTFDLRYTNTDSDSQ